MILLHSFYELLSITTTPTGYEAEVVLNPDHEVYKGHFPDKPVVPGACTLSVVREVLSEIVGCKVRFDTIKECKFVSVLTPEDSPRVVLAISITDDTHISCIVSSGETVLMKLRATFKKEQ